MTSTGPLTYARPWRSRPAAPSRPELLRTLSCLRSSTDLAERVQGLDVDLPGAAEAIEVVDVVGAERRFQRGAQIVDRHAAILGLGPVDDQFQPGRVGPEAGEQALADRVVLARRPPPRRPSSAGRTSAVSPRILTMILKPPAVPRPSTGGAPKMLTMRLDFLLQALLQVAAAIASPDSSGVVRFSKSSSIRYSAPKFEALAPSRIDWPEMATVCLTPLVSQGDLFDLLHHVLGPRRRGGVGHLHVDEQVALVLLRNEAGRRVREAPPGQAQQAAVDAPGPAG